MKSISELLGRRKKPPDEANDTPKIENQRVKAFFGDKYKRRAAILMLVSMVFMLMSLALALGDNKPANAEPLLTDAQIASDKSGVSEMPDSPDPTVYSPAPEAALSALRKFDLVCLLENAPSDDSFVKITDYIPNAVIDLRYSTSNNFTGQVIYDFTDAYLRFGTVKKLMEVQSELEKNGMTLVIWDAFRPVSAQFTLWNVTPNSSYVANPTRGYSTHSRGNTVDVTLAYTNGELVSMPSGFDDFSARADRYYSDVSSAQAANAKYLTDLMVKNGFTTISSEWWHFADSVSYPASKDFDPSAQ